MFNAHDAKISLQRLLGVEPDGDVGPVTRGAFERLVACPDDVPWPVRPTAPSSLVENVVSIAERELGVKEIGANSGARIREYQQATWLTPGAWPWCAAFVCWVVKQAVMVTEPKPIFELPLTAGAWDFERWAREQATNAVLLFKPARAIHRGDIVVYTFSHIGICVGEPNNGRFATIEGNTNDEGGREGDGVYRKLRKTGDVRSVVRIG